MKRILIMTEDKCDDAELLYPYYRVLEEGWEVAIAANTPKIVAAKYHFKAEATLSFADCSAKCTTEYDGLILPGGTAPEKIRQNADALRIVKALYEKRVPICAICHGPQILLSAGLVNGRRMTCYPGIADDLKAAGALYEDSAVVSDCNIITSRRPEDLPYFMREFINSVKNQ